MSFEGASKLHCQTGKLKEALPLDKDIANILGPKLWMSMSTAIQLAQQGKAQEVSEALDRFHADLDAISKE